MTQHLTGLPDPHNPEPFPARAVSAGAVLCVAVSLVAAVIALVI